MASGIMAVIGGRPVKMNPNLIDEMEDRVRQRTAVVEALNQEHPCRGHNRDQFF